MKKIFNVSRKLLLFTILFYGEIALSFSDRSFVEKTFQFDNKIPISARLTNNLSRYESMLILDQNIEKFMKRWNIVGASVAVVKDEKLIYSKGFGYADKENEIPVEPNHLFRVASVSKLITAVAIMRLVEDEELSLEDRVFGKSGILNDEQFQNICDPNIQKISVKNLLNHTSGWTNKKGDPLYLHHKIGKKYDVETPVAIDHVIKYMLENRKLDFTPGSKSNYLNFGYALLSEIISKVSGLDYEDYVSINILNPLGIYDMHLGATSIDLKKENEVKYYGLNGELEYKTKSGSKIWRHYQGNYIETLGGAGAWIASPSEIMKLVIAIDGMESKPDFLSHNSIVEMVTNKKGIKPIGWTGTNETMWWRTGTLSGTSALLLYQHEGISWFMVINTSPKRGSQFPVQMNRTMIRSFASIEDWPTYDLFDYYEPNGLKNNKLLVCGKN